MGAGKGQGRGLVELPVHGQAWAGGARAGGGPGGSGREGVMSEEPGGSYSREGGPRASGVAL